MQTANQSNLLRLALGMVAGLIVGLTIGWGLWPVQWENSGPQYLNKQAKYEYVQTIAEAYFSTHDLPTANARLMQLAGADGNVPGLLQSALDDLGNEGGVKRSSLLFLSSAIGPGQTAAVGESAPVAAPEVATSTPIPSPTPAPASPETVSEDQGSGFFDGLAGPIILILAAAALIVGGLFVAYRWAWSSSSGHNVFGTSPSPSSDGSNNPARIPADALRQPFPSTGRVEPLVPSAPKPAEPAAPSAKAKGSELDADYISQENYKGSSSNRPSLVDGGDEPFHPTGPILDFEDEPSQAAPSAPSPAPPVPTVESRRREEADRLSSRIGGLAGGLAEGITGRLTNAFGGETGGGTTVSKAQRRPTIQFSPEEEGYFEAEFLAGDDFEIAKAINRGDQGYIGEGGMAVSKLSTGTGAESATALEVWLFEKSQISTLTQHLLSPHLFRSGEWDPSKLETKDPQPLEATKGLTFKLEGEETVLHCRISDVEYLASGPPESAFRRLRLEMVSEVK